jgi:hypothetical protein
MSRGMSRFMRNGFIASMGSIIALGLMASFLPGGSGPESVESERLSLLERERPLIAREAAASSAAPPSNERRSFWQGAGQVVSSIQQQLGLGEAAEPVLVVFVEGPREVALVRAAVSDERVTAENANGFALREGRIVAAGTDAAGEIVTSAGWIDRKLTLMRARKQSPKQRTAVRGQWEASGLAPERLAELLSKDQLSYAEASELLDHI